MTTLADWRAMVVRVRELTAEQVDGDSAAISRKTSFVDDLALDARQSARLRRALQDEFGVEIPKTDAKDLATVGDLTRYIEARRGQERTG